MVEVENRSLGAELKSKVKTGSLFHYSLQELYNFEGCPP